MMRSSIRAITSVAVSIALLVLVFSRVETDSLAAAIVSIDHKALGLAAFCIIASLLAASVRYWSVLHTFRQDVGFATAMRATLFGLVGGLLFFQMIGQTLSRWATLRRSGVSASSVVVTSLYEKALALAILLLGGVIAALVLYSDLSIDVGPEGIVLVKSLVLLAISGMAVSFTVLRKPLTIFWRTLGRGIAWGAAAIDVCLTLFVHAAMLAAYLSLILALAPDVAVIDLAAASIIIMLAASLPISFAGWGIRELGALFAFGYVGVAVGDALAVSIAIGALSILSLVLLLAAVVVVTRNSRSKAAIIGPTVEFAHLDYTRFLVSAIPIGLAGLVMFHVWLPIGDGFVNTNLADPLAVIGGFLFVLQQRHIDYSTTYPRVRLFVGALSMMIAAGLFHGWLRFGYIDWAFINRGAGWLIILSYFATGGILAITSPAIGSYRFIRILMWVSIVLISADLMLLCIRYFGIAELLAITPFPRIYGESVNPNAFAFQLLLILAGVFGLAAKAGPRKDRLGFYTLVMGLFFAAVYLTASRTAYVTFAVFLIGAYVVGFWATRPIIRGAVLALTLVFVIPQAFDLLVYIGNIYLPGKSFNVGSVGSFFEQLPLHRPQVDSERWESVTRGLDLFLENPILGAGLGAGVLGDPTNQRIVVIHSTPVWILAEFGILGAALVGFFFSSIFLYLVRRYRKERRFEYGFGVLILLIFAVFGLPHDIFYQRLFWFFLGLVLFAGARSKVRTTHPVHSPRPQEMRSAGVAVPGSPDVLSP